MEPKKEMSNEDKNMRTEQNSYDTIRDLFNCIWIYEILKCLLKEPLYFGQIQKNIKINKDIKEQRDTKLISPEELISKLTLLINNNIIKKGIINPERITEGYMFTEYGLKAIETNLPMLLWAIKHDKNMRGSEDKSKW